MKIPQGSAKKPAIGHEDGPDRHARRGRPRMDKQRHVADDLLHAVGEGLTTKSHDDLTIQEIADLAGVNKAMIAYYFGGKDGLLTEAHAELKAAIRKSFGQLDLTEEPQPMHKLIEVIMPIYAEHGGIVRALVFDLMRQDSPLNASYRRQTDPTSQIVAGLIEQMVKDGRYNAGLDVRFATLAVVSLLVGPIIFGNALSRIGIKQPLMDDSGWMRFLGDMLDSGFRGISSHATN